MVCQPTYTVKKGDCLSVIRKKVLWKWIKNIYMKIANANGISNPNLIYPNQVFTNSGIGGKMSADY